LGPIESAAKRISIMGICNKIAGALAPIVLGAVTLKDADALNTRLLTMSVADKATALDMLAHKVILPYALILLVLIVLAVLVYRSTLPEIETDKEDATENAETKAGSIFHYPHLILGVVAIFLYVGAEVLAGDTVISYGSSLGIPLSTAKFFTTCTLLCMISGYIVGIVCIPKYLTQANALKGSAIIGVVFSIAAIYSPGYASVLFIALLGIANSLMWPAIWPLAINGLGKFTKIGSSLLIMGIAGGALLPLLYGWLSDLYSPRYAYWALIPCYLFIAYYATWGHKVKRNA
ncbi:MAG: glucose/galactose MFS transporter, partial [Bacteroidota bacterium]